MSGTSGGSLHDGRERMGGVGTPPSAGARQRRWCRFAATKTATLPTATLASAAAIAPLATAMAKRARIWEGVWWWWWWWPTEDDNTCAADIHPPVLSGGDMEEV